MGSLRFVVLSLVMIGQFVAMAGKVPFCLCEALRKMMAAHRELIYLCRTCCLHFPRRWLYVGGLGG